ncbi:hypothetical protein IFM89_011219, partial [Coptis chinensis]
MPPVRLFGKFVNVNEDPARATHVPEGNAESHLLKPGRSNVNTDGPTCHDPTILNCSDPSHGGVGYLDGTGGFIKENSVASEVLGKKVSVAQSQTVQFHAFDHLAKVASDMALDAKLNVDEALVSCNSKSSRKRSETLFLDTARDSVTPESGCKEKNRAKNLNALTLSEEEAGSAETASAAGKRAGTLDALVEAVKLVADAVSHAKAILSMGEPLPLTLAGLLEACADGHWKGQQVTSEILSKINKSTEGERASLVGDGIDRNVQPLIEKETEGRGEVLHSQKSEIEKSSLVEVQVDTEGFNGIWFPAKVLDLHNGKAYVHYRVSFTVEGNSREKEWVSLTEESGKPPKIRLAQLTTAINYEGTRNRRRDARGDHTWCIGDRVDAFMCNGWLEGIIKERTNGIETYYTIQFPAQGERFNIQAFHLRPSLIWKDDHWIEWSSSMGTIGYSSEGDTSHHKRYKLGNYDAGKEVMESSHNNNPGKLVSDASEPRRSHRKIQPTTRLLEGLETSFSRTPAVSDGKGTKRQYRSKSLSGKLLLRVATQKLYTSDEGIEVGDA